MTILVSDTQLSAGRQEKLEVATPNAHMAGVKMVDLWVIFFFYCFYFSLLFVLHLMNIYNIVLWYLSFLSFLKFFGGNIG